MTTPQEEAERRWPIPPPRIRDHSLTVQAISLRDGFVAGAEWQSERLGPLVEAAREMYAASEYMDAVDSEDPDAEQWATRMSESMNRYGESVRGLLAAADALNEEGGE